MCAVVWAQDSTQRLVQVLNAVSRLWSWSCVVKEAQVTQGAPQSVCLWKSTCSVSLCAWQLPIKSFTVLDLSNPISVCFGNWLSFRIWWVRNLLRFWNQAGKKKINPFLLPNCQKKKVVKNESNISLCSASPFMWINGLVCPCKSNVALFWQRWLWRAHVQGLFYTHTLPFPAVSRHGRREVSL